MHSFFTSDIQQLNTLYNRLHFSFVFLYGRYGTGKTQLIREFCKNKNTIFFSAREILPGCQLEAFRKEIIRCLGTGKEPPHFFNWEQAFSYISDVSFSHRLILVLDEFQFIAQGHSDFTEAFTKAVQHDFPAGKVFLIVSTSSVEFANSLMEDPAVPFIEAVTAKAFLTSAAFYTCQPHLAAYPPKDQLLLYGVTGGLPSMLSKLNLNHSAKENILALFFKSGSPLLFGPLAQLHQELREISTYNFLLEIIASGHTKLSDISVKASIGTNKCAKYLNVLISLGLLRKEFPAAGENPKKVRYVFADHMLCFWYRFVYPNISGILYGQGREIYEQQVAPALDEYLLPVFESVCAEYLERLAATGQAPFAYRHTGSWWTGGTKREPFFRIPLVAVDEKHTVLGICHCSSEPAGIGYLESLLKPIDVFGSLSRYCCIFSASGFSPELQEAAAKASNVWLIELEDITCP